MGKATTDAASRFSVAAESLHPRWRVGAGDADGVPMRMTLAVLAMLFPHPSWPQGDAWSLELLERYASWVREAGFACPLATRITEFGPDGGGTVFKVICGTATLPLTGQEVAFRLTVRPNGSRLVEPWRE
jgi:hypothetical protein